MKLRDLMQRAGIWRAGELSPTPAQSSGFPALDAILPGGGWPQAGLTEILAPAAGIGALRLVLPALAALSRAGHWIIWVGPPHVPYSPALSEYGMDLSRLLVVDLPEEPQPARGQSLWAFEQALRFADCAAALLWLDEAPALGLRRLKLAAESGVTWGILFRHSRHAGQASPALLRLGLEALPPADGAPSPLGNTVDITVLKARGAHHGAHCRVTL
ncbi:MAG: translesion DNA synthesis-associated protein ImuA [Gammaproteobacteria bacterium]